MIFVPKKINVGFQKRAGTYTGKLAYVIYYDEKGVLRKEGSWEHWRDKNILNEEFDNVPTEGFVLNKKTGDYSTGWNHRQAYCRVYDPRGFEFEITIENLLYILENANSIKGKGLEGEFVYGWDGKDLILVPTESPDYKNIQEYSKTVNSSEKIGARNLVIGATYLDKSNKELIYLGKHLFYGYGRVDRCGDGWKLDSSGIYIRCATPERKEYYFASQSENGNYDMLHYKTVAQAKLIKCVNVECSENYAEIYEHLQNEPMAVGVDISQTKLRQATFEEFVGYVGRIWRPSFIGEVDGRKSICNVSQAGDGKWRVGAGYSGRGDCSGMGIFSYEIEEIPVYWGSVQTISEKRMIPTSLDEIYLKLQPCYWQFYLNNGAEAEKVWDKL